MMFFFKQPNRYLVTSYHCKNDDCFFLYILTMHKKNMSKLIQSFHKVTLKVTLVLNLLTMFGRSKSTQ